MVGKGDFVAAFGRNLIEDQFLSEAFQQNWEKNVNSSEAKYRFENFRMKNMNEEVSIKIQELLFGMARRGDF